MDRDRRERIKSEIRFTEPIAFVFGGDRFIVNPPVSLLMFQALETIGEDWDVARVPTPTRDRWALSVNGRILAVTKPDGKSQLLRSIPEDDYTLTLSEDSTRTRPYFRKHLETG